MQLAVVSSATCYKFGHQISLVAGISLIFWPAIAESEAVQIWASN